MAGKIYEAIPAIMSELKAVEKNDRNDKQKYKYRGIDAVMNAVNPLLVKNHVFIVPEVLESTREERKSTNGGTLLYSICKIKFSFCAEDGSHVDVINIGEGMDSGDKATNKAMAVALKYALFQLFCIPTEEMRQDDTDRDSPEPEYKFVMDANKINSIRMMLTKKGVDENAILERYGVPSLEFMDYERYTRCMAALEKSKDVRA